MTFFAVLFALLVEQLKPLPRATRLGASVSRWVDWTARNLDAGRPHHAVVVWCVAVLAPALVTAVIYLGLRMQSVLLARRDSRQAVGAATG